MTHDEDPGRADAIFGGLKNCGWFDDLPRSFARSVLAAMKASEEKEAPAHQGLAAMVCDGIYLLDDKPYTALLRQFVTAGQGAISIEAFEETVKADRIRFVFGSKSSRVELDLPAQADDLKPSFVAAINEALLAQGSPLRFFELHRMAWGPIPAYALTTEKAFNAAVRKGLVPGQEELSEIEEAKEEARLLVIEKKLERILRGSETYTWELGGEVIAELTVPSGFEATTNGDGPGVTTILAYDLGGLALICAPDKGALQRLPKGYKVNTNEDSKDLLGRSGTMRDTGTGYVWRQRAHRRASIHVLLQVLQGEEEIFDQAFETFRLLRDDLDIQSLLAAEIESRWTARKAGTLKARKRREK